MEKSWSVLIVGHNTVLNELMAAAISRELGVACRVYAELDQAMADLPETSDTKLLLVDDADQAARRRLLQQLPGGELFRQHRVVPALFNVDPQGPESCQAARRGVVGLLLQSVGIQDVLQGVRTLLQGEPWIPREVHARADVDVAWDAEAAVRQSGLTRREVEVLSLVSTGATNEQIAVELCISPNTVKTHMYNIFRKIGVKNRFRAALWVTHNVGGRPSDIGPTGFAAGQ